ncbi:MAG TPA: EAL domain-containing protein [Verrucomicrobiae bacterium]|nr:EAL domain-containing protein [Verrucomicrobiae bacterium]
MRFFSTQHRGDERLIWSRDTRFLHRLRERVPGGRVIELSSGACLIAPLESLTETLAAEVAGPSGGPDFGLVPVDASLPESEKYLHALTAAVQLSGIADRIGMSQTVQEVQSKMLDLFFAIRTHDVYFQPIVELATGELHEYECLFRPNMPRHPASISAVVDAAIATGRAVELDTFIVRIILERIAGLLAADAVPEGIRFAVAINTTPASLLDPHFEAKGVARMVRLAGIHPRQVTLECTEQQAVRDIVPLQRQVKALRKLGFGFAIDDAGAGYASFTLIAALRPTIIKIDREIVHGCGANDAKKALVEAFVSFGRRINARLIAEGIETRRELETLRGLGVEFGQGYLLGRPAAEPGRPRSLEPRRPPRPRRPRPIASPPA